MATTLDTIARRHGVSRMTVSYALRGRAGVSETLRQQIERTAEQLGYRPNAAARTTRTGRFGQVALLNSVDAQFSYRPLALLDAVHDTLAAADLNTVYVKLSDEKLASDHYTPRILRELMVDGLLVNYRFHIPPRMVELIEVNHLPVVWIGALRKRDCVYSDDRGGARQLTERLIELGHRRIAYVDFDYGPTLNEQTRPAAIERRAGYQQAMADAGLQPMLLCGERAQSRAPAMIRETMSAAERPTAMVCVDSGNVERVLTGLCDQLHLSVPGDVSVCTIGSEPVRFGELDITMMRTADDAIGREAVKMLLRKIAQPRRACQPVCPVPTFIAGQTMAGPPRSFTSQED